MPEPAELERTEHADHAGLAVDGSSKLSAALDLGPGVLEYVVGLNPHDFARLRNPLMRRQMPKRIRLDRLARMLELPLGELLAGIHAAAGLKLDEAVLAELGEPSDGTPSGGAPVLPSNPAQRPSWASGEPVAVVDLLAADERLDTDPIPPITRALVLSPPSSVVLVKHKWEPQPLYDVWARTGTEHWAERRAVDEWWIWVRRPERAT